MDIYLILAVAFGVTAFAMVIVGGYLAADARRFQERVETLLMTPGPLETPVIEAYVTQPQGMFSQVVRPLAVPIAALMPSPAREKAREKLTTAGMVRYIGEAEFLFISALAGAVGVVAAVMFFQWFGPKSPFLALVGAILLLVVGALLPDYWLQNRVNARKDTIRRMLPDALDLILVSLEAGMGFDAAMSRVRDKFPGPISDELDRVLQEMRLGKTRAAALKDMADRTALPEVSSFVSAICLADQLGVAMSQVLKAQSQALREKRMMFVKEMAQKLPVKMLFPLVFCIFPAIFVVVVGSGVIRVVDTLLK
jgi:tight adherence protein C